MTYALDKLHQALTCMAQHDSLRDGLAQSIAQHLACIRIKDLPDACRAEFAALLNQLCTGRILEPNMSVRKMLDAFDNEEITVMRASILRLHDAVAQHKTSPAIINEASQSVSTIGEKSTSSNNYRAKR